jgi:hypothetical protein
MSPAGEAALHRVLYIIQHPIYIMHLGAFCRANAQTMWLQLRSWTNCNLTDQLQLNENQMQLNANPLQQRD